MRSFGLLCKMFEVMELLLSLLPKSLECHCSVGRHVPPVWPKTKRLMDGILSKEKRSQGALPVLSSRVHVQLLPYAVDATCGPFLDLGDAWKWKHAKNDAFQEITKRPSEKLKSMTKNRDSQKGKTQTRTAAMFTNTRNCVSAFS